MNYTQPDINGEWEQSGTIIFVGGPKGAVICQMAEPRKNTFVEFHPLELGSKDWDEQMANARLIKAAPKMHKQLLSALGSLVALNANTTTWGPEIVKNIVAVLDEVESTKTKGAL